MLFSALAAKVQEEGIDKLLSAIACYLDATAVHLDGGYLIAHMGLEALLLGLADPSDLTPLVQDKAAWKELVVSTVKPSVAAHLVDKQDEGLLVARLMDVTRPPVRRVLDRFLSRYGIQLPKEVRDEMRRRNEAAHGFWMNPELDYEIDRDYRRLEIVLTVIAAVVACYVGYKGPLKGYDFDDKGCRPSPSWWPISETATGHRIHFERSV
jgi:hypothetical protein